MAHIALPASRPGLSPYLLASPLLLGMFFGAAGDAQAQTSGQGGSTNSQRGPGAADRGGAEPRWSCPAQERAQRGLS